LPYFSTAFHPAIGGQTKWMIQTLEDMLQAWDKQLALIVFSGNHMYHSNIEISPLQSII